MKIYDYTDYKSYLTAWVNNQKALGLKVTYQEIAKSISVQKTYLSKVLSADAELSVDQSYLLAQYLRLDEGETDYLSILVDCSRTGIVNRKKSLKKKIDVIRSHYLKVSTHLKDKKNPLEEEKAASAYASYYLDPWHQVIHMALMIERFQQKPLQLAKLLNMPEASFKKRLGLLEKLGIISLGKKIEILEDSLHIDRGSDYFWSWRQQILSSCFERSRLNDSEKDLNFSVVFTGDAKAFETIKVKLLDLLESCQEDVSKAPSKELYQLNIDLVDWQLKN